VPWSEQVLTAAAIIVAVGVIIGAGYKVYKVAHRIDAALGVDRQGRTLSERLARVEHQLWPNGGTSLADKLNRLEEEQHRQSSEIRVVRDLLTKLIETDRA
jgi:hypothetical protein